MHEEFNKIIGYEPIKHELDQLCDVLKYPEKYQRLEVQSPSGLRNCLEITCTHCC